MRPEMAVKPRISEKRTVTRGRLPSNRTATVDEVELGQEGSRRFPMRRGLVDRCAVDLIGKGWIATILERYAQRGAADNAVAIS